MRALFGGVIGAVVSASAWLAIEHYNQANYSWMVWLVGLVTGLAVHRGSTSGSGGLVRGALAVILTFAAIVGGRHLYIDVLQAVSPDDGPVTAKVLDFVPAKKDEKVVTNSPVVMQPENVARVRKGDYSKSAIKKNFTQWDTVWMSLAALTAYITGKGGDKLTAVPTSEKDSEEAAGEQQES